MLYQIYTAAGFHTLRVSAETGEGIQELSAAIAGKLSAFTGNSGVGEVQHSERAGLRFSPPSGRSQREAGAWEAYYAACRALSPKEWGDCSRHSRLFLL